MKKAILFGISLCVSFIAIGQTGQITGLLIGPDQTPIIYANMVLHLAKDSSIVKVEPSDDTGRFSFRNIAGGAYFIRASYVGLASLTIPGVKVQQDASVDLGKILLGSKSVDLQTATVTAQRVILEVKADRTVFNVQGTINSAGQNAIELLRKAPGVFVDNNENISVLSRSGVLVYIDGKRLPLTGDDLSNYLRSLPAEQIDRMDIITNPSAKYEAEGNAGIIDIHLKKDKNIGANGTVSTNASQGRYFRGNVNLSGNYRNKKMNIFGNAGVNGGQNYTLLLFNSTQNNIRLNESNRFAGGNQAYDYRLGTDLFIDKKNTLGFMVSGRRSTNDRKIFNRIAITGEDSQGVDSLLVADNTADDERTQYTFNINYRFESEGKLLNVDLDYGRYRNGSIRFQPNRYFDQSEEVMLTEIINTFDTPRDIDIYTFKLDYEKKIGKSTLSLGSKVSAVSTDNTFLFFDQIDGIDRQNDRRSNRFFYDENVYAGYMNINGPINEKWKFSAGLRAEQTDATGDLRAFVPELEEPPVDFNYLSWFPSAGLTYQMAPKHAFNLNYGRRINRPDYNVLNPFNNQLSEISYEKGNPFLQPEIVNNLELGYTLAYRYNFKLAYSRTIDQITRLIGPSDFDERANFITWANLANQQIYSLNISAPFTVVKGWDAYINFSGSHIDNQADYGDEGVVDVQVWSYNFFQQHTLDLGKGYKGEVSGWFSGPGVWGGVFLYDPSWSLNIGLQKKFLGDKLNVKLSVQDIFYESGWSGVSSFNGLVSTGSGNWDSRRASISLSYNFGNQNIKARNRRTGIEEESKRVGG